MNTYLYDDIINLPHHVSSTRKHMSMDERAAQFAPFAALSGYGDDIKETVRIVDNEVVLDEEVKVILDEKINIILEHIKELPEVSITYFIPDKKKNGGRYEIITGNVRIIDSVNQKIELTDKSKININKMIELRSNLFKDMI